MMIITNSPSPSMFRPALRRRCHPSPLRHPIHWRAYASEAVTTSVNLESTVESFGGDEAFERDLNETSQSQFYASSIFPIQLGKADPRPLIATLRNDDLLDQFSTIASFVDAHSFKLVKTDKQPKAGGVFLTFSYVPLSEEVGGKERALKEIKAAFDQAVTQFGGLKTWGWLGQGKIWEVKGNPWYEDLNRFPSSQLKVAFEGPDVNQEALYDLLRPFGHIANINPPTPQPPLSPRFSTLAFSRLHSSTAAVSCLHGLSVPPSLSSSSPGVLTRLSFTYESPIQAHAVRDWISGHPRIALPVLVALLGTLSYTFFDPIRDFFVTSKIEGRFDLEGYSAVQYTRKLASSFLPSWIISPPADTQRSVSPSPSLDEMSVDSADAGTGNAWRERQEAERMAEGWLREYPSGFIFVTGPAGSGKSALIADVIAAENKKALIIDCREIAKAKTDGAMIASLAHQAGYWPMFGFLASFNQMIDLAAVGLIGQKTGFSTDFSTQLKQVLDLVSSSLKHVTDIHVGERQQGIQREKDKATREAERIVFKEKLKRIGYHDGRLDDLAGNGIMSELGYGDERLLPSDLPTEADATFLSVTPPTTTNEVPAKEMMYLDSEKDEIQAMPVVVLKNFAAKGNRKNELWNTIAEWSASLVENKIAQVIVVCDNTSASKPLAKALPSRPINTLSLADADVSTSLLFVADKLNVAQETITPEESHLIGTFGGRLNDLEGLVNKVRSGLSISESVEDLLQRSQVELRKSVFGDDEEESKALAWSRPQAWKIVKSLSEKGEIPYQSLLMAFPFKGAEDKLKNMEAAEIISLTFVNGRPSMVKPGKPMMHASFKKLVEDPVFNATQTISYNAEVISGSVSDIKNCETELLSLKDIGFDAGKGILPSTSPIALRADYLLQKMRAAQTKINDLEKENAQTLAVLNKHV